MKRRVTGLAAALTVLTIALTAAASAGAKTVWLCQPGHRPDPCAPGLSTTVYSPTRQPLRVIHPQECRVFAPVYRQVTVPALESGNHESPAQLKLSLVVDANIELGNLVTLVHRRPRPSRSRGSRQSPEGLYSGGGFRYSLVP